MAWRLPVARDVQAPALLGHRRGPAGSIAPGRHLNSARDRALVGQRRIAYGQSARDHAGALPRPDAGTAPARGRPALNAKGADAQIPPSPIAGGLSSRHIGADFEASAPGAHQGERGMAKVAIVTGAGTGVGRAAALALMKAGYCGRAGGPAQGAARGRRQGRRRQCPGGADRRDQGGRDPRAVRQGEGEIRPARRAVQQCRHGRAAGAVPRAAGREVEGGRRHQPHRAVRLHARRPSRS